MPLYFALAVPAIVAVAYVYFGWTRATRWLGAMAGASVLATSLWLSENGVYTIAFGSWLRTDSLAIHILITIAIVATLALAAWPAQLDNELKDHVLGPVTARWYGVLAMLVLAASVLAVSSQATLLSLAAIAIVVAAIAGLVASRRKPAQKRAAVVYGAWCAGGLVLATVGTLMPQGVPATSVTLTGLAVLAGLAPLHWWLPTTVSVATAPVAVLVAGVQAPLAWSAIVRLDDPPQPLLVGFALVSLAVAVAGMARQRDLRRLVAHLGLGSGSLVMLALAVGTPWVSEQLVLWLSLNAAVLYLAAGHLVSLTGSGRIATVRGLLSRNLLLGEVFGLGLFAATLLAPWIAFSRMSFRAEQPLGVLGTGFATGLAAIAVLTVMHGWQMLTGDPATTPDVVTGPARPLGSAGPVLIVGIVVAILAPISPPFPAGWF